jgi:NADH-quinone oxidoreductase subunit J
MSELSQVVFWVFAVIAVAAAFLCVTRRSPVASALWLVQCMFSLAALFVLLDAQFIAAVQVMVYAGAIMVLFLFVIMLLNLGRSGPTDIRGWPGRISAIALAGMLVVELWVVHNVLPNAVLRLPTGELARLSEEQGIINVVADPLFHTYLIPFEITGVLLLAATAGAIVLAKRKL